MEKYNLSKETKEDMDAIVNELLPIYRRLKSTGLSMQSSEYQKVMAAGNKAYDSYGFEALKYGVQQLKSLCPSPSTRPEETWGQVLYTKGIKSGEAKLVE